MSQDVLSQTLPAHKEHELLLKLEQAGLNEDDAQRVIQSNRNTLAKTIIALLRVESGDEIYTVSVDYSQPLVKAGQYDYANPKITAEHFPAEGEGVVETEVILVHFDRNMESDEVIKVLDAQGLRPAAMIELVAFGAQYPDIQRQFPVVALGSVWVHRTGYRSVGYLWGHPGHRGLYLDWYDDAWSPGCRFLAVRK